MKDDDQIVVSQHDTDEDVVFYDPFGHHFVSQNKRNDFLTALEEGQHETIYSAIH